MNLILYGFKSCGKTTFGQNLAKSMGCFFYDTDQLIEALYQTTTGQFISVRDIFKTQGEAYFRKLETRALSATAHVKNSVIAVGGGCILDPVNRSFLEQLGKLVYLKTEKEIIKKRIFTNDLPGFLDPNNPIESFEQLFNQRTLIYEQIFAYKLIVKGQTEESEIISQLKDLSMGLF